MWYSLRRMRVAGWGKKVALIRGLSVIACLILASCATRHALVQVSHDGEFIEYNGSVMLSGVYFTDAGNIEIQDRVCFWPDAASQNVLPRRSDFHQAHWMCFSNDAEARQLLGMDASFQPHEGCYGGRARITIEGYARYIAESEGVSVSDVVNVYWRETVKPIACEAITEI